MNELALFAGAGGGLLATKWLLGWRTVCYVENSPYRVKVLRARIRDGLLDDAPIWDDARTFDGRPWAGSVDIVTAGFPCQPFSGAGKGLAELDDRNLWPSTIRIVGEVRPEWVLLENVSRLLSHAYVRRIFGDLAEGGYDCRWDCIPASAVGANHQRDRLWIVAHSNGAGWGAEHSNGCALEGEDHSLCEREETTSGIAVGGKKVADPHSSRLQERPQFDGLAQQDSPDRDSRGRYACGCGDEMADADQQGSPQRETERLISYMEPAKRRGWWETEPGLGRVVDGLADRVERVAAIGDGQVPAVVAAVWRAFVRESSV